MALCKCHMTFENERMDIKEFFVVQVCTVFKNNNTWYLSQCYAWVQAGLLGFISRRDKNSSIRHILQTGSGSNLLLRPVVTASFSQELERARHESELILRLGMSGTRSPPPSTHTHTHTHTHTRLNDLYLFKSNDKIWCDRMVRCKQGNTAWGFIRTRNYFTIGIT